MILIARIFGFSILVTLSACSRDHYASKRYQSYNPSGVSLRLEEDSTFVFSIQAADSADSTQGIYRLQNDTIFFVFKGKVSAKDSNGYFGVGGFVPIAVAVRGDQALIKPKKLLVKGQRLYYMSDKRDQIDLGGQRNVSETFLQQID